MANFRTTVIRFTSLSDLISTLPLDYSLDPYHLRQRQLVENLDGILRESDVRSVVLEEYVDRHFIHDFCGHYGSCYHDYPKKCIRLHFFDNEFDESAFKRIVTRQPSEEALTNLGQYIGYIILRPLPTAIFGNVALKAPEDSPNALVLKKIIKTHLCGLELIVETIPFQEQDKAISACATSALWTALHAFPGIQSHNILSPHRLTEKAKDILVEGVRSHVITRGLTIAQMAGAVKSDSIIPLVSAPPSTSYMKAVLRAYLNARIPVVLGIQLYYSNDALSKNLSEKVIGHHAVTVLGYREDYTRIKPFDAPDMREDCDIPPLDLFLESSAIATVVCHDDQIGPFSAMTIPDEYSPALTTGWGKGDKFGAVDAKVVSMLVPCPPKVRIRFSTIYEIVKSLNLIFADNYRENFECLLLWDIRLETVCSLKAYFRSLPEEVLDHETKFGLLTLPMPRYVWVVDQSLYWKGENSDPEQFVVATYLFDATDIENSNFLIKAIHYNEVFYKMNKASFQDKQNSLSNHLRIVRKIGDYYLQQ